MIPSNAEKTLLRTRPQSTKLWLSVYKPPTVLACQVATSHGQGAYQIDYDTVTAGSYTAIESGMTMYIGSTPGASDIGKLRVRSADASQITVAENSDIDWTDGQYLTIVRFWEINAVFPRIIQDPADETNTLWYKDYDIVYTNQNDVLGSFICMGSHFAGFIATGSCGVYYSASGTHNLLGETVTYDWWFQGATVTGSSVHTPGFIQYNTPGHYTTRLRVTTPTGTYDSSYRHISIYQRPELGTNNPILRWEVRSLSGSRDESGYTARLAVYQNFSDIVDGALVVIFADDEYGDTKQSIGNTVNRGSIVFVGYIQDGSISVNYKMSSLEFNVTSPTGIMKQVEAFAVGVNSSSSPVNEPSINENIPSAWAVVKNMDCRRAIYHYLRWHSTVLMTNDFEFSGTDQNIQYFDADRESIYSAIQTLMDGTLAGDVVCGRDGKIWAEVSAAATDNAAGSFPLNISLEKFDWMGDIRIQEDSVKKVSYLEMGGIYFPGPGFDSTPLLASAPGASPSYRGNVDKLSGLALASQAQLNTLVGNVFAWKNARYPSVQLNLTGNYRNLDIAPIERVQLTLSSEDNIRGISWANKNFVINGMDFNYDPRRELFLPSVDLHEITQGIDGATISIPPVPPVEGFNVPTLQIPSIPSFPISITISGGGEANYPTFVTPLLIDIASTPEEDWAARGAWGSWPSGLKIATTEDYRAMGQFKVPKSSLGTSFTGTIRVYPWFTANGSSGNAYVAGSAEWYGWKDNSTALIENNATNSLATVAISSGIYLYQMASFDISLSAGWATYDIFVRLYLRRNGPHASDTYASDIWAVGWSLEYI